MKSNNSSKSPASIEELVQFISTKVRNLHEKSGQRMDGSLLAYTIRSEYPQIDYTQLGLSRLGDAVRIAEKSGLVVRHRDVKHLELSPPDVTKNEEPRKKTSDTAVRKYVRNDVWRAFLLRSELTKLIDRETFEIIEIPPEKSKAAGAQIRTAKQLEIERIPDDTQVSWAKQFISLSSPNNVCSDDEAKALIFSKASKYSASYLRSWKAFLSSKVIDYITAWAAKNAIRTDQILVPTVQRSDLVQFGVSPSDEAAIRRAIIAAIKEMPLSELDSLAIPIKYIRQHFVAK